MTIKGKCKRKIVARFSISLVLCFSFILSSLNVTFASAGNITTPDELIEETPTRIPQSNSFYGPTVTRDNLNRLYDETSRVAIMFHQPVQYSDANGSFTVYNLTTITSYDELLFIPSGSDGYSQGVYSRSEHDAIVVNSYGFTSGGGMNTYWCSNIPIIVDGFSGYWYRCSDTTLYNIFNNLLADSVYYCNAALYVYGRGTIVSQNLDISAFLPRPTYLFNATLDEDSEYILCTVNFNPREYGGMVTLWGYNELTSFVFYYTVDEFIYRIEDDQGNEPAEIDFYLDLGALKSTFIGKDFHISSISCLGWLDHHEETLSVDWNFSSVKTTGEYDPPDTNYYYSTYYNENYHYAEDNGNVVAFGNVDICLYSDQNLDRVFWDKQKTLLTPYKYSYVFLPASITNLIGVSYYDLLDELILEFDIVVNNCPTDVFDAMYGQGAEADFLTQTTVGGLIRWYNSHFRFYDLIPYEYFDNLPTENYQSYDCTCFYTDSFYFKSLAYLLGDSNERLLEFESRLMGEDGAMQVLLSAMKSIYDDNYNYHTDMLTYMDKLNYLVNLIITGDYFSKYLSHLESIDNKLSDISNALTGTNEEDFDNQLHAPWLQIYRYFKNLFNRSLSKLPDFLDTTTEILDGGSDQVGIGFTLDNDYEQVLPLNSPSVSPTPIPIPTLFP